MFYTELFDWVVVTTLHGPVSEIPSTCTQASRRLKINTGELCSAVTAVTYKGYMWTHPNMYMCTNTTSCSCNFCTHLVIYMYTCCRVHVILGFEGKRRKATSTYILCNAIL